MTILKHREDELIIVQVLIGMYKFLIIILLKIKGDLGWKEFICRKVEKKENIKELV